MKCRKRKWLLISIICAGAAYLAVYLWLSFRCLNTFPFVHSDESWLAGLSRDMMAAANPGVTESFFDAKPRVPHAMKILFHLMQMAAISLGGYSVSSVRALSLAGGVLCLAAFYCCARKLGGQRNGCGVLSGQGDGCGVLGGQGDGCGVLGGRWSALGLTVLLSLDIQFIYASHFARQEIWIGLVLLCCIGALLKTNGRPGVKAAAGLGLFTGIGAGLHPNGFLCGAVCGCVLFLGLFIRWLKEGKAEGLKALKSLAAYTAILIGTAAVYIRISFLFAPHFLPDYFTYGKEEFDLSPSSIGRFRELFSFFASVYRRENGTYYLPDVRLQMIGMALAAGLCLAAWLVMRKDCVEGSSEWTWMQHTRVLLTGAAGLTAGMVVIGRYNQTSILFFFLFGWLLAGQALLLFEKAGRAAGILILAAGLLIGSGGQIRGQLPDEGEDYASYLSELARLVPDSEPAIGNLNMEFYFEPGKLRDYRNLPYVMGDLPQYVKENRIRYICYSEELDFLYENRPYYNTVYGNAAFVKELKEFCLTSCEEVGRIENPAYASRVTSIRGAVEYGTVIIYRVFETPGAKTYT